MIGKLESCCNVKVGQKGILLIFQAEGKLFLVIFGYKDKVISRSIAVIPGIQNCVYLLQFKTNKQTTGRGASVAQLAQCPALDSVLGHYFRIMRSSPVSCSMLDMEPA